jgi:nucleotide-binding universal stress UspA family protein
LASTRNGDEGTPDVILSRWERRSGTSDRSVAEPAQLAHLLLQLAVLEPKASGLRALRLALPDAGEPRIEPGKPWEVILDFVEDTRAALIVIGSRRLSGVHAFGSVSRRIVHGAPCSVLVLPPSQQPR